MKHFMLTVLSSLLVFCSMNTLASADNSKTTSQNNIIHKAHATSINNTTAIVSKELDAIEHAQKLSSRPHGYYSNYSWTRTGYGGSFTGTNGLSSYGGSFYGPER